MDFDVCVVGAGPAGSTCALILDKLGLKTLLVDRAHFPRDKVCADNKSWICTSIIKELGLQGEFDKLPRQEITKMLFSSPGGQKVVVPLNNDKMKLNGPHYNIRREVFDNFLFQNAKLEKNVKSVEGFAVTHILRKDGLITISGMLDNTQRIEFYAKVVVGADGSESEVAKSFGINPVVLDHHAICARAYFEGVSCDKEMVELHYLKGVCPGYFWIFPVDNNKCNVGLGLRTLDVKKRKLDINNLFLSILKSPEFSLRFASSHQISNVDLWGITVGSKRRTICGDNFLLVGDAANTAVTFAGEGVGPAMRSGKIAAYALFQAFKNKDLSHKSLRKLYEDELWKIIGPENQAMSVMEILILNPAIFDFVMSRTSKNKKLLQIASDIGNDYKNAKNLLSLEALIELVKG